MKKLLNYLFFGVLRKDHELTDKDRRRLLITLYVGSFGYFYYSLKDRARSDRDGQFTFRDVLRYYDLDSLADKLDAAEAKALDLPEPNLKPSDEELLKMFEERAGYSCTCGSTDEKHLLDCDLWPHNQQSRIH